MLCNFQQVFSTKKNLVEQKVWNFKFCDFANWVPPTNTFGSLSLYFSMVAEMLQKTKFLSYVLYLLYEYLY